MSRRTQAFVLVLFGAVLLRLGTSDLLLRFVRPGTRPLVIAAGALVLAVAVWSLVADARGDTVVDEHGHGASTRVAWLALLPVAAILVIGPPALGAFTANRDTRPAAPADVEPFGSLPAGTARLSVAEFVLRSLDRDGRTLTGRTATLTGFVARNTTGGFVLARLIITCCAADAVPVEVVVRIADPPPARDRWVQVTGVYAGQAGTDTPLLRATGLRTVAAPADPYDH